MINAHVTGSAGLRLSGLPDGEEMPGVADIARCGTKPCALSLEVFDLSFSFQSNLVTSTAPFHSLHQGHGLPMGCRHGLHGSPRKGMLALLELFHLRFMAAGTRLRCCKLDPSNILSGHVPVSVTFSTSHGFPAVLAQLPIGDDVGGYLAVTLEALLCGSS